MLAHTLLKRTLTQIFMVKVGLLEINFLALKFLIKIRIKSKVSTIKLLITHDAQLFGVFSTFKSGKKSIETHHNIFKNKNVRYLGIPNVRTKANVMR